MPRLVRRKPWADRLKAYLNPYDFLLWLSEEFETSDWDTKGFANTVGSVLNLTLLVTRANSGGQKKTSSDDVFGDGSHGAGWLSWLATLVVHLLTWLSVLNAAYTFYRKRHYRLFENSVDVAPGTPNAHRVRVDSSPATSSPLRLLNKIIGHTSAESRSHPDPSRDVWELAVWDPLPICLRLFCLFSPGHVLVYWLFLPISASDPRPSTTVVTTILLEILLSTQLVLLQSNFSQQTKDTAVIHKEVLNEYDIKYVHPRLNPTVRDVGTQYSGLDSSIGTENEDEVDTYTPTTILRRGFKTNPNPNYSKYIDPESTGLVPQRPAMPPSPLGFKTPSAQIINKRESSPLRTITRQPQFRQSVGPGTSANTSTSTGDGGSLGIYSHANSPLKKATSMYNIQSGRPREVPRNSFQAARREITEERERSISPIKRVREIEDENGRRRTSVPPNYSQGFSTSHDKDFRSSRGHF